MTTFRNYSSADSAKATLRKHGIRAAAYADYLGAEGKSIFFEQGKPMKIVKGKQVTPVVKVAAKPSNPSMAGMFAQMIAPQNPRAPKIARVKEKSPAKVIAAKRGIEIEKNRETKNGITKPSRGGRCCQIWDEYDKLVKAGTHPTAKHAKELSARTHWNPTTCVLNLYVWRKFHGFKK
jgi:hypothetical protein